MASSSGSAQIVLITGANRGIGNGILKLFLSRPNTTVIAALRDVKSTLAKALTSLPKAENSSLIMVKIDSSLENDAAAAVEILGSKHDITKIDTVIANAGIPGTLGPVVSITADEVLNNVRVNSLGPLFLFQATLPLLNKSSRPKFVVLGSQAGSIGDMEKAPFPMAAYGSSKAMTHYFVRKIHFEHKDIISFAVEPGFTRSDSGNAIAQLFGQKEAAVPILDSANFIVSQIDAATKDTLSGHFPAFPNGERLW